MVAAFGNDGWRLVLCTSVVPSLIALVIRFGTPESPLWHIAKGRPQEALANIHAYLGNQYGLPDRGEEKPASTSWFALFAPEQWRNTVVSGVFFFAQVLPFFAISIFLPLVLTKMNIQNPNASGVLYNVFTLIGVLVGLWIYGIATRRAYLLWTFYVSAAILTVMILWTSMSPLVALIMITAFALVLAASIVPEFSYPAGAVPNGTARLRRRPDHCHQPFRARRRHLPPAHRERTVWHPYGPLVLRDHPALRRHHLPHVGT